MLVALSAVTVKASAMPGSWPQVTATSSGEMRSGGNQMAAYGSQLGHLAVQPSEVSDHTSSAFNWTDASVGAGVTAVLGLIGVAGALRLSRRRVHGQIAA
jgi:MYXO-CTERM domain-containing protein